MSAARQNAASITEVNDPGVVSAGVGAGNGADASGGSMGAEEAAAVGGAVAGVEEAATVGCVAGDAGGGTARVIGAGVTEAEGDGAAIGRGGEGRGDSVGGETGRADKVGDGVGAGFADGVDVGIARGPTGTTPSVSTGPCTWVSRVGVGVGPGGRLKPPPDCAMAGAAAAKDRANRAIRRGDMDPVGRFGGGG